MNAPAPNLSYIHADLRQFAVPVDSLVLDPSNVRLRTQPNLDTIRGSFVRFGQRSPIVVRKEGMVVSSGNGRLMVARELGWSHIAAIVCDDDAVQAAAFAIADNRSSDLAEWDVKGLVQQLESLQAENFEIADIGFMADDLDAMLADLETMPVLELVPDSDPVVDAPAPAPITDGGTCLIGDALATLRELSDGIVQCCVTSPPYWGLRDYGHDGQVGLEETPEDYVARLVEIFREVRRVLRDDGTLWLNLGDTYSSGSDHPSPLHAADNVGAFCRTPTMSGLSPKNLVGIPWRVAFALQADGWYLRQDIIWHKPNPMPESVTDRCTNAHEYVFLLSKHPQYYYDAEAVKEDSVGAWNPKKGFGTKRVKPAHMTAAQMELQRTQFVHDTHHDDIDKTGRNKRSVWTVATTPYPGSHFATFPPELIRPCIMAGCPEGGVVLDPFFGSGTVGQVSEECGRHWLGIELNPKYAALMHERLQQPAAQPGE